MIIMKNDEWKMSMIFYFESGQKNMQLSANNQKNKYYYAPLDISGEGMLLNCVCCNSLLLPAESLLALSKIWFIRFLNFFLTELILSWLQTRYKNTKINNLYANFVDFELCENWEILFCIQFSICIFFRLKIVYFQNRVC